MRVVNQEDLLGRFIRTQEYPVLKYPYILYLDLAVAAVYFMNIGMRTPGGFNASRALPATANNLVSAGNSAGEQAGYGELAYALRPREQISPVDIPSSQIPFQSSDRMILADNFRTFHNNIPTYARTAAPKAVPAP
jgi:hypothetical protein